MKKGEKPQLDSKWWEKNKAKTLLKTGVGEALRVYEAKMDKFDYAGAITALKTVKTKTADAAKQCNKTLHAETLECLLKFPGVISEEEKRLNQKIEEEKNKPKPPPKQQMGSPEILWSKSIGLHFFKLYGSKHKWLKSASGGQVELRVNGDIQKLLIAEKAEVIAQRMVDRSDKLFVASLGEINNKLTAAVANLTTDEEKIDAFEDIANTVFSSIAPMFKKIPAEEWKKFLEKKEQYRDYQIKCGFNAAITTLKAVGTGLAIAAAVPTGGASLALAVVGGVSTVADAVKQIRDAAQEAETVLKRLVKNLEKMRSEFLDTEKKALAQAKAVGSTIANTILNFPVFPSLKSCEDDCGLADNKTAGLNVKHVKLGGDVSKAIKKLDELDKLISKAPPNKVGKIQKGIIKTRETLSKALDKCSAIGPRVDACEELVEKVKEMLDEVKSNAGTWLKVFDKVFPVVYNLAMAAANAGVGFADAKNALETANTAISLTNDILIEVKNQVE